MGSKNKKQEVSGTSTSVSDIAPEFKPFFLDNTSGLLPRARDASLRAPQGPYSGEFFASPNTIDLNTVNAFTTAAPSLWNTVADTVQPIQSSIPNFQNLGYPAVDLGLRTLRGDFLDPNNPITTGAITAATNPARDALQEALLRIEGQSVGQGAFGGSALNNMRARAITDATRNMNDTAASIVNQFVNRERGLQTQAPQMVMQGLGLQTAPATMYNESISPFLNTANLLTQAGAFERGLQTLGIQNDLAKWNEQTAGQFRALFPYAQIAGSVPIPTSTSGSYNNIQTVPGGGGIVGGLQGAIGGAAAGFPIAGPWGAAAGGILGGITGFFG